MTRQSWKGQTRYSIEGKVLTPISDRDFDMGTATGLFFHPKHRGLVALLFYTGIRVSEALRAKREQFVLDPEKRIIVFNVGKRLKHGKETPPLVIPADAPWAHFIWLSVKHTNPGEYVWSNEPGRPYCRATAYNICRRCFKYPHLFRLSRITNFFNEGRTIAQVKNWTGLTLNALEFYVGIVDVQELGKSLNKTRPQNIQRQLFFHKILRSNLSHKPKLLHSNQNTAATKKGRKKEDNGRPGFHLFFTLANQSPTRC